MWIVKDEWNWFVGWQNCFDFGDYMFFQKWQVIVCLVLKGFSIGCFEWYLLWMCGQCGLKKYLFGGVRGEGILFLIGVKFCLCWFRCGVFVSSVWVQGCFGELNRFLVDVFFIIWFRYMIVIWLVMCLIMFKLWLMNRQVRLNFLCRFMKRLIIWVWIDMFRVVMVLLQIRNFGLIVSVWVMLICCCCLLENWCVYCCFRDGLSLILCMMLFIQFEILDWEMILCILGVFLMMFFICILGLRLVKGF